METETRVAVGASMCREGLPAKRDGARPHDREEDDGEEVQQHEVERVHELDVEVRLARGPCRYRLAPDSEETAGTKR